jgi:hypothetical protein
MIKAPALIMLNQEFHLIFLATFISLVSKYLITLKRRQSLHPTHTAHSFPLPPVTTQHIFLNILDTRKSAHTNLQDMRKFAHILVLN